MQSDRCHFWYHHWEVWKLDVFKAYTKHRSCSRSRMTLIVWWYSINHVTMTTCLSLTGHPAGPDTSAWCPTTIKYIHMLCDSLYIQLDGSLESGVSCSTVNKREMKTRRGAERECTRSEKVIICGYRCVHTLYHYMMLYDIILSKVVAVTSIAVFYDVFYDDDLWTTGEHQNQKLSYATHSGLRYYKFIIEKMYTSFYTIRIFLIFNEYPEFRLLKVVHIY